jgi:formate dehydrogenase major subunit
MSATATNRRAFLRHTTGLAGGTLAGLGLELRPAQAAAQRLKLQGAKEYASVCPYCAVGCGQVVSVRQGQIVNIEGNPDSPINAGTLCPKGSATYQLAVNPNRLTTVKYRRPYGTVWEDVSLDWAMDRIAERVKATRDASFREWWDGTDAEGRPVRKRLNHTPAIASLGGATMDNEWNYLQLKMWRALGGIWLENQARI